MRHRYSCPMRWADLDMLGHVNNVTYVDYLQEARVSMLTAHARVSGGEGLADGVVVASHQLEFAAPLAFGLAPVAIECWVTEIKAATFTMGYEVFEEEESGERTVFLRATSVLAPYDFVAEGPRRITREERAVLERHLETGQPPAEPLPPAPGGGPRHVFELATRFSDVDAYGHVNNVKYVEYFQEARIQYLLSLRRPEDGGWREWVVAATDLDYLRPVLYREQPYQVGSWVQSVGERSVVLCAELCDGASVLARGRVVMVGFDRETQRSAPLNARQRQRLRDEIVS